MRATKTTRSDATQASRLDATHLVARSGSRLSAGFTGKASYWFSGSFCDGSAGFYLSRAAIKKMHFSQHAKLVRTRRRASDDCYFCFLIQICILPSWVCIALSILNHFQAVKAGNRTVAMKWMGMPAAPDATSQLNQCIRNHAKSLPRLCQFGTYVARIIAK